MQSAKKTMDSFGGEGQTGTGAKQDIHEVIVSFREMLESVKGLTDELKVVAVESKRPGGTINELEQTVQDVSSAYRTVKRNV
jgi:hypothetical protein